jgi:signal transduction histidine kinase
VLDLRLLLIWQHQIVSTSQIQTRALLERQQLLNEQQHRRLARKIHDEISQKMTLLTLQLSLLSSESGPPLNWADHCNDWTRLVMELGQSIREITSELQPRILDEFGLASALRWFAQCSAGDICCAFHGLDVNISLAPFVANELFGICREIVADILVPARAARVDVELEEKEGMVRLQLRASDPRPGLELITEKELAAIAVHDRLLCLDGTAELSHSARAGSVVTLTVPARRPTA